MPAQNICCLAAYTLFAADAQFADERAQFWPPIAISALLKPE